MFEPVVSAVGRWSVKLVFGTVAVGCVRADVFAGFNGTERVIRDGGDRFAAGGFTVTDHEVPVGVTVTYRAEMFDAGGVSLGFTGGTDYVVFGEEGYIVFSDPLVPELVVEVAGRQTFGESLARSRPMERYQVGEATVFLSGQRGLLQNIDLSVVTDTLEQANLLARVLASSFVLVRTTPRIRIPSLLYVAVPDVDEREQDVQFGGERIDWPLTGQEMTRTEIGVAVSSTPYQTYMDAFPTYADAMAAYGTYLDAMKNPPVG